MSQRFCFSPLKSKYMWIIYWTMQLVHKCICSHKFGIQNSFKVCELLLEAFIWLTLLFAYPQVCPHSYMSTFLIINPLYIFAYYPDNIVIKLETMTMLAYSGSFPESRALCMPAELSWFLFLSPRYLLAMHSCQLCFSFCLLLSQQFMQQIHP